MKITLTGTAILLLCIDLNTDYSRINKELLDLSVDSAKSVMEEKKKARSFADKELTVEKKLVLPYAENSPQQNRCEAELGLSYTQAVSEANVKAKISLVESTSECPNPNGQYLVRVRSMSSNGEPRTQEFTEYWQLGDERTLSQAHSYDLKADPDLLWVRLSSTAKTRCVCELPENSTGEPES